MTPLGKPRLMNSHFAAVQNPEGSPLVRALRCPAVRCAANDNGPVAGKDAPSDIILRAALRHFATHGLGAARAARSRAQDAFFAGDREAYDWWLEITRTLDRRLAIEAAGATGPALPFGTANSQTD